MQKIISFDIWDTILKRRCHPEEIKLFTARYMLFKYGEHIKDEFIDIYKLLAKRDEIEAIICEKNQKNGHDNECRIFDVFEKLQHEVFKDKIDSIAKELVDVEVNHEIKMTYVNSEALDLIEKYKDNKKYCVSDFYMGKEDLKRIINSKEELRNQFIEIYSSADFLLNKKSGNLFTKFEEELNIKPSEHIHIGDNEYADIEVPKKMGIETIQMRKYGSFDFNPVRNRTFDFALDDLKIKKIESKEDELYNAGISLSPLLYFFVNNLVEYGIRKNIPKIHYQTREGETFIKIHEMIAHNNPYEMELPESEILEVSRVATFAASLKEFSIGELLRLWSQYRCQSLKSLFKTLNVDIEKYKDIIDKYDIDVDQDTWEPWFNYNWQNLFADEEFKKKMDEEIKIKRESLMKFFETKGIYDDDKPMMVVDLGWRGTIQDNLAYIYKNKQIDGYYYALYDYYNVQPKNTSKFAFIKDMKFCYEYIGPMITLFEMLFNPESGSVVKYEDGKAIRKVKESEYNTVKNVTSHIQKGMFDGAKKINEYLECHPFENSEFDSYIYDLIKEMKQKPSKDIVEAYYSLVHNDTFGTGEYVDKRLKLSRLDKLNVFKCRKLLEKEEWKEAFMIHNNTRLLKCALGFKAKLRKIMGR